VRDRRPQLEAISLVVAPTPGFDSTALARRVVRRAKLTGWRLERVVDDGTEVELVPPRRRAVRPGRAWDLTYALRDQPEVVHAEPLFRYLVPENAPRQAPKAGLGGSKPDPKTDTDFEWSLKNARVLTAWPLFGSREPGAGVRVGHPDTGYTPHPELADPARVLVGEGFDYDDDDADPLDDLTSGFLDNPSHGTGTGSVILSGAGPAPGTQGAFVSGAAPFAELIPIRTTESVVLFSMRGLRKAIDHAVAHGAHVVSMSLGGPFKDEAIRRAVQRALDAGLIVLAAAGNQVRVVVFPAAFDEVIAVAANNVNDGAWSGSCRGPAVDITAPGESVWRARSGRDKAGAWTFVVERGDGTSFAVATTAGIAALWLSFHGWEALRAKYGPENIARVFKQLLQASCRTPAGWNTHDFGPGIVDARALLEAPLPASVPARKLRDARRAPVAADASGVESILHLLPGVPRTRVEPLLADLLHVPDRDLPSALQDYGDELAFHLVMQPPLLDTLRRRARGARATGSARQAVRRRLAPRASVRLRRQLNRR
jgi:thermitase